MGAAPKKSETADAVLVAQEATASSTEAKLDALSAKFDRDHAANNLNFAKVDRKLDLLTSHIGVADEK